MQILGLGVLVLVVAYGFSDRNMTQISAFDLHAFVVVLGGCLGAILTCSGTRAAAQTLLCIRELLPGSGTMDAGTQRLEEARVRFSELWRDGKRAQAVELAEGSALLPIRKMLSLVLARSSEGATDSVFLELRHAEIDRWQPATSNWELLARLGPSFGMVGTITGMIQLFRNMANDDLNLGAALSLALIATLYGIAFGAGVAGPIGHRMRALLDQRLGALARCRQDVVELAASTPRG